MEYSATEQWIKSIAEQLVINNKLCPRDHGVKFTIDLDVDNFGYEKRRQHPP